MAGLPWFKVASDFPSHPKTLRLCALLGDTNAGMYVVRLLAYCATYAPDGRVPLDMMRQASGWTKQRARLELLVSSLETAGFIICTSTHAEIHGWDEWNGAHVRKSAKDNARPRSDYRLPRAGTPRGDGGNSSGSRAGDVEGEGEKKKQLPSPAASAGAGEVGTGLETGEPRPLMLVSEEPTAKRKPKSDTDPRFAPLKAAWVDEYRAVYGEPPRWSAAESTGIHRVIAVEVEQFRVRARRGLHAKGFEHCATVAELTCDKKWNRLAGGATAPRPQVLT